MWRAGAGPAGTHASRSPGSARGSSGQSRAAVPASDLFSEHLLQDVPIEREIPHHALQPRVLLLELLQPPQLGDPEIRVLLLPDVEGRFAHAHLSTNVRNRHARLGLPQCESDLLLGVAGPLHAPLLPFTEPRAATLLSF